MLQLAHDNAFSRHQGVKMTLTQILDRFWWSTVNKDTMDYTKSCHTCEERMPPHQRARAPFKERPIMEKPSERVEIDIKGGYSTSNRQRITVYSGCIFQVCRIVSIAMTDNRRRKLQDSRTNWWMWTARSSSFRQWNMFHKSSF